MDDVKLNKREKKIGKTFVHKLAVCKEKINKI